MDGASGKDGFFIDRDSLTGPILGRGVLVDVRFSHHQHLTHESTYLDASDLHNASLLGGQDASDSLASDDLQVAAGFDSLVVSFSG